MAPKVGSSGAGSQASGSGWAPLRKDALGRPVRTRGKFPLLETPAARDATVEEVRADVYATSSQAGTKSGRKFLRKALAQWGQEPDPPSADKIELVATVLKQGCHRSASSYLGQYRTDAEHEGYEVTYPCEEGVHRHDYVM